MNEKSLIKTAYIYSIGLVIFAMIIVGSLFMIHNYSDFLSRTKKEKSEYIEHQKELIKNKTLNVIEYINYTKSISKKKLENTVKQKTNIAYEISNNLSQTFNSISTPDTILDMIKKTIGSIIKKDCFCYYFIIKDNLINQIYSPKQNIDENDYKKFISDLDSESISNMIKVTNGKNEGYYLHKTQNSPYELSNNDKLIFIKFFEPLDIHIATGSYLEIYKNDIQKDLIERFDIYFSNDNFLIIGSLDGDIYLSNIYKDYVYFKNHSNEYSSIYDKILETILNNENYLNYTINPTNGESKENRIFYVDIIEDLNWYVAIGIDTNIYKDIVLENEQSLFSNFLQSIIILISVIGISVILLLFIIKYFTDKLKANFGVFLNFFKQAENDSVNINTKDIIFSELKNIGESANKMIEERRKSQRALAKTNALLRESIEQSSAGIVIADAPNVEIVLANTVALSMRGLPKEKLTHISVEKHSTNWATYYPDGREYNPIELPLSRAVLKGETCKNVEVIIKDYKGNGHWVLANATPVRNNNDEIIAGVVVFSEITEIKKIEKELKLNSNRTEALLKLNQMIEYPIEQMTSYVFIQAIKLTRSRSGMMIILTNDNNKVVALINKVVNSHISSEEDVKRINIDITDSFVEDIINLNESMIINKYDNEKFKSNLFPEAHENINKVVIVPAVHDDVKIVLIAADKEPEHYTQNDVKQLKLLIEGMWMVINHKKSIEKVRDSLSEKDILLKEIHHRVKNNLQIINSLLNLQSRKPISNTVMVIKDIQNRIMSMALVHEILYESENLAKLDFNYYVNKLVRNLLSSYKVNTNNIKLDISVKNSELSVDIAIPCSLIINELVSNSIKYAFGNEHSGTIIIRFDKSLYGIYTLTIGDNGIGLPKDIEIDKSTTLGLTLVRALARQLNAELILDRSNGTKFNIYFKEKKID